MTEEQSYGLLNRDKTNKKLEELKKKAQAKKDEANKEKEAKREKDALTNPTFSMHSLKRLIIGADETYFTQPMHAYELASEMLIHPKVKNEKGEEKYAHVFCIDILTMDTDLASEHQCQHCKHEGYQFEPKPVLGKVDYVYNTIGDKRSFTGKDGSKVTYYLNPAQVVEIQSDGKGGSTVLPMFKTLAKDKLYEKKIWGIRRESGKPDSNGVPRGGGFVAPEIVDEEELITRLGKEGVTIGLPEYAQKWADSIKEIHEKQGEAAAKDEVFRYILTSFDNAEEVVEIINKLDKRRNLSLPKKPEKNSNTDSSDLMFNKSGN